MTEKKITLKDLEVRYHNIRKRNPKVKKCTAHGCPNPRDSTRFLGESTSCAYHRLLFDFWESEVMPPEKFWDYLESQKGRRRAFTNWRNKTGKDVCDEIVLRMALEPINWEC